MPRIPYRYPAPKVDSVADRIRERRGARGLTPLDGMLLNAPSVADGWNTFVGGLRTRTSLPDDIRELMILRVAACNKAAFEWIHHEHLARNLGGMSYEQLSIVGHLDNTATSSDYSYTPRTTSTGQADKGKSLSSFQAAALAFADASTRNINVPTPIFETFKTALADNLKNNPCNDKVTGTSVNAEQQIVEAMAVVGGYNLVSRFLVGLDIDNKMELPVPIPETHRVPISETAPASAELHTVYIPRQGDVTDKTIIFVNSLLTDYTMWRHVWDKFTKTYNIVLFDQRGHGQTFTPSTKCTMQELAGDVKSILDYYKIIKAWAVIGVSQGGATTLQFAIDYPDRSSKVIACDTQAKGPQANIKAWDDRIALAKAEGMGAVADSNIPRWFSEASSFNKDKDFDWLKQTMEGMTTNGFAAGAGALQGYDLLEQGLLDALARRDRNTVLLMAGEMDGKLPEGLKQLAEDVNAKGGDAKVDIIAKGGHLPMVNEANAWSDAVLTFLKE